eukprot:TRINITY_DN14400_c0_g1_i1.p1 TRINITY_DN14400_c0_g1~~TRINITY_DN14400_c0_g1_i1.p1  ORF type:complete len:138 (+),score=41.06 TRINITY_DN14400_c0_g1_i1:26-415(+)
MGYSGGILNSYLLQGMMQMFLMICLVVAAVDGSGKWGKIRVAIEEHGCCPSKKIWGSPTPSLDGVYDLVQAMDLASLPKRCNSPCVYQKRGGGNREARKMGDAGGKMFCFADSMVSQSECTFVGRNQFS